MEHNIALSDMELMTILDDGEDRVYYGCDQEWFIDPWQRLAGCGPTVASNILMYQDRRALRGTGMLKSEMLLNMNRAWQYIFPEKNGIASTGSFLKKVGDFAEANNLALRSRSLDIGEETDTRPKMAEVVAFIQGSLESELPVAFLNLCNGSVVNLDKWHWVTICQLAYDEDLSRIGATICDEGEMKVIDLKLWLETTTLGGGFASFTVEKRDRILSEKTG